MSSHDFGLRDLIESATLLGGLPRMFVTTISIAAQQPMGTELQLPVCAVVDEVVRQVQAIVQDLFGPKPRSDCPLSRGNENA